MLVITTRPMLASLTAQVVDLLNTVSSALWSTQISLLADLIARLGLEFSLEAGMAG